MHLLDGRISLYPIRRLIIVLILVLSYNVMKIVNCKLLLFNTKCKILIRLNAHSLPVIMNDCNDKRLKGIYKAKTCYG